MKLRYKYRVYPTESQKASLACAFGHSRFVYNYFLNRRSQAYRDGEKLNYPSTSRELTSLKKTPEHIWLNDVSSVCLQQSLRILDKAFGNFFNKKIKARYPKFKKRESRQAISFVDTAFTLLDNELVVSKIGKLKVKWHRELPNIPSSLTLIKEPSGQYYVSFVVEREASKETQGNEEVGIDLGIKDLATLSNGEVIKNPKTFKKHKAKLARRQKALARKVKGSKRRQKSKLKVARQYQRIKDSRKDYHHKVANRLIEKYDTLYIEDLNIKGMAENQSNHHNVNNAILDSGLGQFIRFLKYKAELRGKNLIQIDRYFPSSKTCRECGNINSKLKLSQRKWTCRKCQTVHNRDLNAAKNILAFGKSATAHGDLISV